VHHALLLHIAASPISACPDERSDIGGCILIGSPSRLLSGMPFSVSFFEGDLPVPLIAAIPMSETKSGTKKRKYKRAAGVKPLTP
jgi:hypothetical protein